MCVWMWTFASVYTLKRQLKALLNLIIHLNEDMRLQIWAEGTKTFYLYFPKQYKNSWLLTLKIWLFINFFIDVLNGLLLLEIKKVSGHRQQKFTKYFSWKTSDIVLSQRFPFINVSFLLMSYMFFFFVNNAKQHLSSLYLPLKHHFVVYQILTF